MLLPSVPWPPDSGARIRNAGLLRLLSEDQEVDAIAFDRFGAEDQPGTNARRLVVVSAPPRRTALMRMATMVGSQLPDMAVRLWSADFSRALACLLAEGKYDAVQAEGIEMARYLGVIQGHTVYDAHNAEFLLQQSFTQQPSTPLAGLYSRLQWRRLERFERMIVRRSRMTLAVSSHDANQLNALAGSSASVNVIPNAIDVAAYPFQARRSQTTTNLLFLGTLDFRPNVEGLRWFIEQVLPRLKDARLFAVGGSPPARLIEAGQRSPRIAVTGQVADERPYLARAQALVLPLRSGGGSRLKALIAMASGLPIVSTAFGMEGFDAEPGHHYLIAESAAEWEVALGQLAADPDLGGRLAANGRELVQERYDWSALRSMVRSAYSWLNP
jgi:glycosyltransferase involved in cell wall biosynthesis